MQRIDTLRRPSKQEITSKTKRSFDVRVISSPDRRAPALVVNPLTQERLREEYRVPSLSELIAMQQKNLSMVGPIPIYEQSRESLYRNAKEKLSPTSSTREYIKFFKEFFSEEGLPEDWQKLQYGDAQVGFSINKQMELLQDDAPGSKETHALQTYLDMQGFLAEYVSPYIVFPWQHELRVTADGTAHLVETRYASKRMIDLATRDERGGAVKSVLEEIDQIVVTGKKPDGSALPNGSMILEVSPSDASETGLFQDNGKPIMYKDTHIKLSQVRGDKLVGFTIQTDFTKAECRELLYRLTGKRLPKDAPIEDYIKGFAIIDPTTSSLKNIQDLVGVAEHVRSDMSFGSKYAFKEKTWDQVREQIRLENKIYNWTVTSQAILKQYVQDVIRDNPTRAELPYYMAATILRAVQAAQMDQLAQLSHETAMQQLHYVLPPSPHFGNFGEVLKAASAFTGCAGGGPTSKDGKIGKNGVEQISLACPKITCGCGWEATDAQAADVQERIITLCPDCDSPPGLGSVERKIEKQKRLAALN